MIIVKKSLNTSFTKSNVSIWKGLNEIVLLSLPSLSSFWYFPKNRTTLSYLLALAFNNSSFVIKHLFSSYPKMKS